MEFLQQVAQQIANVCVDFMGLPIECVVAIVALALVAGVVFYRAGR